MFLGTQSAVFASKSCPVDLQYQQIYDSYWSGESDAIQHQFQWQDVIFYAPEKQLQKVEDFTIGLTPLSSLQKADWRSPVYGYHSDGSLNLNGGKKKSYNDNFTSDITAL